MTKYMQPSFSVNVGTPEYRDGWDRVFGKKDDAPAEYTSCVVDGVEYTPAVDPGAFPSGFIDRHWVDDYAKVSEFTANVADFHRAFGQPVGDKPAPLERDRLKLRLGLIAEEFVELLVACGIPGIDEWDIRDTVTGAISALPHNGQNLPEIADALGDLDYVIEGMRLEMGINGMPIADEIHRSNMSKLGADGQPVYRSDGKVTKGPNYSPPDVAGELRKQGWDG